MVSIKKVSFLYSHFLQPLSTPSFLPRSQSFVDSQNSVSREDTCGAGVETPKKQKYFCTTVGKRQKPKNLMSSGRSFLSFHYWCRVPYYIFLSTIWWGRGYGNSLVQIEPKNGFETEKVQDGYRNPGSLPLTPTSPSHYYRDYSQWLRADFWVMMFAT